MKHYLYTDTLRKVWEKAVESYRSGARDPQTFFNESETGFLHSIGQSAQEFFDYAEDFVSGGEPDFGTVVAVADIRRSYFLEVQNGLASREVLDPATLPPKDSSVDGIDWLPRILPKALAKLRGELHPSIMYGCGGDRSFFRANDLHPAEFLRKVWAVDGDAAKVLAWVKSRRPAA